MNAAGECGGRCLDNKFRHERETYGEGTLSGALAGISWSTKLMGLTYWTKYYRLLVFGKEPIAFLRAVARELPSIGVPVQGSSNSFSTITSPYLLRKS